MLRLYKIMLVTSVLWLLPSLTLASDNKCFSRDDIERVNFKDGYMHDVVNIARNFFEEFGFCPPGSYIAEQLKLSAQHPEIFGGPLRIFDLPSSCGGVPDTMATEERDHYIFYYGDPSGLVSAEVIDSRTGTNHSLIITDQGNMGQSTVAADQYVLYELQEFVAELNHGANPEATIDKYVDTLAFAPDNVSRAKLEIAVSRSLLNIYRDLQTGPVDLQTYAYQLGHLRAAVWEESMDLRDQRLSRHLKYR